TCLTSAVSLPIDHALRAGCHVAAVKREQFETERSKPEGSRRCVSIDLNCACNAFSHDSAFQRRAPSETKMPGVAGQRPLNKKDRGLCPGHRGSCWFFSTYN